MKMSRLMIVGLLVTLSLHVGYATADTLLTLSGTSQIEDTLIRGGTQSDLNYGGYNRLRVGKPTGNVQRRTLMRFLDFSALSGKEVTSATLRLNRLDDAGQTADVTVEIYEILSANADWVEGGGGALGAVEAGSSCWDYKKYDGTSWKGSEGASTQGTDYSSTLLASAIAVDVVGASWVEFSLPIATIQDWVDNGTHYGLYLRMDVDDPGADENGQHVVFKSSEAAVGTGPELVIEYVPEPATMVLLGLGGVGLLVRRRRRA